MRDREYNLSDFDNSKQEIPEKLTSINYHDLEDFVYRNRLTYNVIMDVLHIKYFPSERTSYTLPVGLHEKAISRKL